MPATLTDSALARVQAGLHVAPFFPTHDSSNGRLHHVEDVGNVALGKLGVLVQMAYCLYILARKMSAVAALDIFCGCDCLKVVGVDAGRVTAKVIQGHAFRNGTVFLFVVCSVRQRIFARSRHLAIAIAIYGQLPYPARCFVAAIFNQISKPLAALMATREPDRLAFHAMPLQGRYRRRFSFLPAPTPAIAVRNFRIGVPPTTVLSYRARSCDFEAAEMVVAYIFIALALNDTLGEIRAGRNRSTLPAPAPTVTARNVGRIFDTQGLLLGSRSGTLLVGYVAGAFILAILSHIYGVFSSVASPT